ncbi:glutamate receptor U1 [Boleophthalmus pectinirostris]|uniref:glutamate receptor U1 n=1 Tax=Boleophthalmus pectinirostris TaxID=150288 RepID=UPI0024310871|nr:glutamate receptor U1 [Boleophthalmus pectinirostris]
MRSCMGLVLAALCALAASGDVKELSITTIKEEPYAMSHGSELEGYCIDLLTELAKRVGFTYKVHLVKDGRYGAIDQSGQWSGMIGEVIRGEADLAVAPLTLTSVRERHVDMSTPFLQTGLGFILNKDLVTHESALSLLAPFSADMWVGLLIAFLLTGLSIFLVCRMSPSEWAEPDKEQTTFTLLHSFWYITGALTLQGAGPHPKAVAGRVITAVWWLFAVLLLACYFANFYAMIHTDKKHASIRTFSDLANQDVIEYGAVEGGSTSQFFKTSKIALYQRMYEQMEKRRSFVANMGEGMRRAQEGNFAFIGEAVSLDLAVARYCSLTRSEEVVSERAYSIAAPRGFPLMKNLSIAILELSESGTLAYLRNKWWARSCMEDQEGGSLEAHDLRGLFVLGLGLGLGVLLALLELLTKAHRQAKDDKRSCCSVLTSELGRRFGGAAESAEAESEKSKA